MNQFSFVSTHHALLGFVETAAFVWVEKVSFARIWFFYRRFLELRRRKLFQKLNGKLHSIYNVFQILKTLSDLLISIFVIWSIKSIFFIYLQWHFPLHH